MSHSAPYVYAQELFPLRNGLPLWLPEPTKHGQIQLGDVGYRHDGGFFRLFNATREEEDPLNAPFGVPDDFKRFKINPYLLNEYKEVIRGSLQSRSVSMLDVSGDAGTAMAEAGAGLQIKCHREHGAFVFFDPPADKDTMHPSKALIQYMRTNIQNWQRFAVDACDVPLKEEDIIFVTGVVRTTNWGLGAFVRYESGGSVSVQASFGPYAQGSFKLQKHNVRESSVQWRTRPGGAKLPEPQSATSLDIQATAADSTPSSPSPDTSSPSLSLKRVATELQKDQALFLSYYKMKRRLFFRQVLKAAAGPDEQQPYPDSDEEGDVSGECDRTVSDDGSGPEQSYDPVDHVLDYILDYVLEDGTQADTAIASIEHLYALFQEDVPEDIPAALEKLRPPILFIDEGVAALACAEWGEDFDDVVEPDPQSSRAREKRKASDPDPQSEEGTHESGDDADEPSSPKREDEPSSKHIPGGWNAQESVVLQDHTGGVSCLAWSRDGRYIASGSEDATVIIRDGNSGEILRKFLDHTDGLWSLAFSPDSTRLATGATNGNVLVYDLTTPENAVAVVLHPKHEGTVQTIQYSPDGELIATCGADSTIRVWDAATGTELRRMKHEAMAVAAVFSHDGKLLASASGDYRAAIWDVSTGERIRTLEGEKGIVWAVDFDAESRRVVTCTDKGTCTVWSVESGAALVHLEVHPSPVWFVAFSPDGKLVMTVSNDSTIKLSDSFAAQVLFTFDRHDAQVSAAVFSPDGKYVASSGGDNEVLIWSAHTGKALPRMEGHADKITALRFSPDSERLVSASDDGTVRIWTIPEGDWDEPVSADV